MQTDVIHLHNQRHRAIDHRGNHDAHQRQRDRLQRHTVLRQFGQGDGHDLGRKDEVGLDRAGDLFLFQVGGVLGVEILFDLVVGMGGQHVEHLFRALETQIGPAQHQKRRHRQRQEPGQEHQPRQEHDQLVLERALGDAPDDRQLAVGLEPRDISWRHGGVVDHHARRLGPGLGRRRRNVVNRGRRHLGNRRDIVQQRQQSAHPQVLFGQPQGAD